MRAAVPASPDRHGGNLAAAALRLGCRPDQLLDASASLVPFPPPRRLRRALAVAALRPYPDRGYGALRRVIADLHGLDPAWVLPGNGAAELFTWAARDAAAAGVSLLPQPGFADYGRALACWGGASAPLPLDLEWPEAGPTPWPAAADPTDGVRFGGGSAPAVLWITNPHNPTGQLWSRRSLEPLLARHALVICDEAFLPLVPGGEAHSLVSLLAAHPNLVVIRSLTKLFAIAGLRLGYALGDPQRLARWSAWRDPWPVNAFAAAAGEALLADRQGYRRWCGRVQGWVAAEGAWLQRRLAALPGVRPLPSAANYLLLRGDPGGALGSDLGGSLRGDPRGEGRSLEPLRLALERRHRILLRDCRSFAGLGEGWLRLGYQSRAGNRRILRALARELAGCAAGRPSGRELEQ